MKKCIVISALSLWFLPVIFQTAFASTIKCLDKYEEVIVVYEKYANKDKICNSDMLKLNIEILPKLLLVAQEAPKHQNNFIPNEMQRYMKVVTRYSGTLMKLGPKMENFTC